LIQAKKKQISSSAKIAKNAPTHLPQQVVEIPKEEKKIVASESPHSQKNADPDLKSQASHPVLKEPDLKSQPASKADVPKPVHSKKGFSLEPLTTVPETDVADMRELVTKKLPGLPIVDFIPDESLIHPPSPKATDAVLIYHGAEPKSHLTFLANFAKAIALSLAPARLCHIQSKREALHYPGTKLIIFCGEILSSAELAKIDKDLRNAGIKTLFLPSLAHYLAHPDQKLTLWNSVKTAL
jgi:hypothetical protein